MSTAMKPIRLPEGGAAALAFPYEGDWGKTQRAAMYGATRANILRDWQQFPQWLRRDPGFECLMDTYCPMTDEGYELKRRQQEEKVRDTLRGLLGSRFGTTGSCGDLRDLKGTQYDKSANMDPNAPTTDDEVIEAIRSVGIHKACVDMALPFGGNTALATNSTSRTVAGMNPRANQSIRVWGFDIGFDGTTSTNGPGIVELMSDTFATNPPGTNSTSVTPLIVDFGRAETVQTSGAKAWTTEPTVLVTTEVFFIPNYMGSGLVFTPLTKPFGAANNKGFSMRITQQSGITGNATGCVKAEE